MIHRFLLFLWPLFKRYSIQLSLKGKPIKRLKCYAIKLGFSVYLIFNNAQGLKIEKIGQFAKAQPPPP